MSNFYTLLGCQENASYDDIKKCYQDLVRKYHPDKAASAEENDSDYFIKITEAWQTLRDPIKRKAYDAHLLAEQCESEHVLYATLLWSELDFEEDKYTYSCRCGSLYSISKEDKSNSNVDQYHPCNECSLGILVKAMPNS